MLNEPVVNFTMSVVDDAVKENAGFQFMSGLAPKIKRTSTGKCCKWCDRLVGTYNYEDVRDTGNNVFRRHRHCRCTVEFITNGKRQNVHTKRWKIDKGGTTEEWERLKSQKKSGTIKEKMKMNLQFFAKIPDEKFTKYALDFENAPDKAKAFKEALGYTKDNYQDLIKNIEKNLDESKLVIKGNNGYGDLYEYVMQLYGPNGKKANVLTAWIREKDDIRLTSAYVTKKEGERMKKIEMYQKVLLKDGRSATIVEILEENKAYIADIDLSGPDWETVQIKHSDIKDII